MNDALCIDASVAVKTLFAEIDSDKAESLLQGAADAGHRLIAPAHFPVEVTSAVYKRVRSGHLTIDEAVVRISRLADMPVELVNPHGLREPALAIAAAANMKWVHDAFYVALAEMQGCELWTADEQLYAAVRAAHPNVRLLSAYDGR